jgi:hypothetical protein
LLPRLMRELPYVGPGVPLLAGLLMYAAPMMLGVGQIVAYAGIVRMRATAQQVRSGGTAQQPVRTPVAKISASLNGGNRGGNRGGGTAQQPVRTPVAKISASLNGGNRGGTAQQSPRQQQTRSKRSSYVAISNNNNNSRMGQQRRRQPTGSQSSGSQSSGSQSSVHQMMGERVIQNIVDGRTESGASTRPQAPPRRSKRIEKRNLA